MAFWKGINQADDSCACLGRQEYPYDRQEEFEAAREAPRKVSQREFWAKEALVNSVKSLTFEISLLYI